MLGDAVTGSKPSIVSTPEVEEEVPVAAPPEKEPAGSDDLFSLRDEFMKDRSLTSAEWFNPSFASSDILDSPAAAATPQPEPDEPVPVGYLRTGDGRTIQTW